MMQYMRSLVIPLLAILAIAGGTHRAAAQTDARVDATATAIRALMAELAPTPTVLTVGLNHELTVPAARVLGLTPGRDVIRCDSIEDPRSCRIARNLTAISVMAVVHPTPNATEVYLFTTEHSGSDAHPPVTVLWKIRVEQRGRSWHVASLKSIGQS